MRTGIVLIIAALAVTTARADSGLDLGPDLPFSRLQLVEALELRGVESATLTVRRIGDSALEIAVDGQRRTIELLGRAGSAAARIVAINAVDLAAAVAEFDERAARNPVPVFYAPVAMPRPELDRVPRASRVRPRFEVAVIAAAASAEDVAQQIRAIRIVLAPGPAELYDEAEDALRRGDRRGAEALFVEIIRGHDKRARALLQSVLARDRDPALRAPARRLLGKLDPI